MALSAALKNKMLAVYNLTLEIRVEIKDDSAAWIDFSSRDPVVPALRLSTERSISRIVSSLGSVTLDNADCYFDYMDDPANATTISLFGDFANDFATGFRGRDLRLSLYMRNDDGTLEQASCGVFKISDIKTLDNGTATLSLKTDVDFLKEISTESLTSGKGKILNKPVSYLLKAILGKVYPAGIGSNFTCPDKIAIATNDGEPAFSHYGKPPEYDEDALRFRDDIPAVPGALYRHADNGLFYVGVGNQVWEFDPATEKWDLSGTLDSDADFFVTGIYRMSATELLVIGWKIDFTLRYATLMTGQLLTASNSLTPNDPANNTACFTGLFVLRDTHASASAGAEVGRVKNSTQFGSTDLAFGVNMPIPFAGHVFEAFASAAYDQQELGFPALSLTDTVAAAAWELYNPSSAGQGRSVLAAGYLAACNVQNSPTENDHAGLQVLWGMPRNLVYVADLFTSGLGGPYLFAVQTDGNPLGIRNTGTIEIVAYKSKTGTKITVTSAALTGASTPIYGLAYRLSGYNSGTDQLIWIDADWKETYDATPPVTDVPTFRIRGGTITESSGEPAINTAALWTLWTSGDDFFEADDSRYCPISIFCDNDPVHAACLVQLFNTNDVGGECFNLYLVTMDDTTGGHFDDVTKLGSSYRGYSSFTMSADGDWIYFLERDTGRLCRFNSGAVALPSTYEVLGNGTEPVPGEFWEMPNNGLACYDEGGKTCLWGVSHPGPPPAGAEAHITQQGKYYLWKFHPSLTDRVELFEAGRENAYEALAYLAEAVGYQIGMDPEGVGFFSPLPSSSGAAEFTIDLDAFVGRHFSVEKNDGLSEIVNRSVFIPYESVVGEPEATADLVGYMKKNDSGNMERRVFNGEIEIRSESIIAQNLTLHCTVGGQPGAAKFKYRFHETQVQNPLREDVNAGDLDLIRLENNADVAAGMLVKVGNFEGTAGGMHVDAVEADGDIDLSENLDTAYPKGTLAVFTEANNGIWSTEFAVPDLYTAGTTWGEIGSTGIFLRFTEGDSADAEDRIPFAPGDRITITNPGLVLKRSTTKRFQSENSTSIEKYGVREFNLDNPYMSLGIGIERVEKMVSDEKDPKHGWTIRTPLFLQARPLTIVSLKSKRFLPTATNNTEKCYVRQVSHNFATATSDLTLRAFDSY